MAGLKTLGRKAGLTSLFLATLFNIASAANTTTPASSAYSNNGDDVKIALNVPEGSGKTDLYFSLEAPAKYDWVGFGIGMVMDNSLMFVVYRSADNQGEPTVSPRLGKNHVMPEYYNETTVNVLEGSGVTDGKFVVNMHCKNCRNWGEGNLDLSSTRGRFFYALGPSGTSLMSDDNSQRIESHPGHPKQFNLDVAAAIGVNGVPSFDADNSDDNSDNDNDASDDGSFMESRGIIFHGFVLSLAFSVVFPLGYLFLRLFDRVWVHWAAQSFGTVLVLLGMVAGIVISVKEFDFPKTFYAHQIVGLISVGLVLIAMGLGGAGHMSFKKKGVPSPLMQGHRFIGPAAIGLGFSSAILGLRLAGRGRAALGYTIFNLLVWGVILGLVFMKKRRNMKKGAMNTPAAQNFRDTNTAYSHVRGGSFSGGNFQHAPPAYLPHDQHIPLQNRGGAQVYEHYNVQPNK